MSKETVLMEEGCMSIPGIRANVRRSRTIDIRAVNPFTRETFEEKGLSSWRARCILHEEDHINGILFIDRLDNDEKKRIEADLLIVEQRYRYHVPKNIL
ncbi:MAG: hypothetical protein A3F09_03755 [Chlamydiae bacterium RIFCSPHIGHO2_12_FULL_49_11]|nr:MAG: hypothetical protein A3F09_03755 [Chlamydiae bacterium RIFCSPHIGHO2_12_FULL_49_11]